MYSGQTCTAPKRIFIQQPIYDEFLSRLVARVRRLNVGSPEDLETDISPVASDLAVDRIKAYLEEAVLKGAKVLAGGRIEGNLVHPTVLRDATDEMLGMREEVFGPVAFTTPFRTREEVLEPGPEPQIRPAGCGLRRRGGPAGGPGTQGRRLLPSGAGLHLRQIRHGVAQRAPGRLLARAPWWSSPPAATAIPAGSGRPWTAASKSSKGRSSSAWRPRRPKMKLGRARRLCAGSSRAAPVEACATNILGGRLCPAVLAQPVQEHGWKRTPGRPARRLIPY